MGLLDRYILRLIAPGIFLGTGVFLFTLLLNELVRNVQLLVTQGANPTTVGLALALLVPGLLAVAVPSALLLGILLALHRLTAGRELIAMRAGGVSPGRLLLPIGAASAATFLLSGALMLELVPRSNRQFVELSGELLSSRLRTRIQPQIFYDELLDGRVLVVGETRPGEEDWRRVFLADTRTGGQPTIFVAESGRLATIPEDRVALLELDGVEVHNTSLYDPGRYRIQRAAEVRLPLDAESVFGPETVSPRRSARAMLLPELRSAFAATEHPVYLVEIHKKFALPFACLAFGLLGLGLGLRPSPGPARAGVFAIAVLVVFGYYIPLTFGEQLAVDGELSPWLAMWSANLLTAAAGALLLVLASRQLDPLAALDRGLARARRFLPRLPKTRRRAVRRLRLPGMPTIVDRYVITHFVRFLVIALAALVAVQTIGRLTAVVGDAFDHEAPGPLLLRYLGLSLPEFAIQMLPLAALTATLVTFGVMSRHSEVTAFLAGGVSRARLIVPVLGVGLAASVAGLAVQETVLPFAGPESDDLGARIRGRPLRTLNPLERHWRLGADGRVYHYEEFDEDNAVLTGLSVFRFGEGGTSLSARRYTATAHWSEADGSWTGIGGWEREFAEGSAPRPFAVREFPEVPRPESFLRADLVPDHLPYEELRGRIRTVEAAGHRVPELRVDLHTKASLPLASFITVLIGVPFAFGRSNRGGVAGAAIALGIGIVYLVASRFFGFLGDADLLDPVLAAWSPNLLFSLASISLLARRPS